MSNTMQVAPSDGRTRSLSQHTEPPEPPNDRFRFRIVAWTGSIVVVALVSAVVVWQSRSDTDSGVNVSVESSYTPLDPYQEVNIARAKLTPESSYTPLDPYQEVNIARAKLTPESSYTPLDPYHEVQKARATS